MGAGLVGGLADPSVVGLVVSVLSVAEVEAEDVDAAAACTPLAFVFSGAAAQVTGCKTVRPSRVQNCAPQPRGAGSTSISSSSSSAVRALQRLEIGVGWMGAGNRAADEPGKGFVKQRAKASPPGG